MQKDYDFNPFNLDSDFVEKVRNVLDKAGFNENSILSRLESKESIKIVPRVIPRLLRMTKEKSPLDVLIRLLLLHVKVNKAEAEKAIKPMSLEAWCHGGLLKLDGTSVYAPLELIPYAGMFFAFDPPTSRGESEPRPDHVHGMGPVSVDLMNATIRRRVKNVLDLGTGCGIQGMMCSRHSARVVSCDINTRALNIATFNAALNAINNIEMRLGSLFEPVVDETFDLITMNPPFVISPDKRFSFRDSGMEGDEFLQRVVKEAPLFLKEGGFCQIIAQWAHISNENWKDRLKAWFNASNCDVWVIKRGTQSIETYAENWITETEKHNTEDYIQRWNKWVAYLESQGIKEISTGIITMRLRRTNRQKNWFWVNEDVSEIDASGGEAIALGFSLRDFLVSTTDDQQLLNTALKISPEIVSEQLWSYGGERWSPVQVALRHKKGLHYQGNIDGHFIRLLGSCNGERPLSELVVKLAQSFDAQLDNILPSVLAGMRNLIERGFVGPPSLMDHKATS